MEWKDFEGKRIYVKLISDRIYSGLVIEVVYMGRNSQDIDLWMISMKDKFNSIVSFSNTEIKFIEEEKSR